MKYKTIQLKEVCKVNQGLQIPISQRFTEPGPDRKFYITVQFLKEPTARYFIEKPKDTVCCEEDDILVVRTGNTGEIVTGVKGCFHNNFFKVEPFDNISRRYLYYALNNQEMRTQMINAASGTVVLDLKHSSFYALEIPFPPIDSQNKIASILSSIDLKISNNRKINQNLQEQAKALYSDMIVDKADGTWFPGTLSDVAIVTMGQSPKGDTYNEDGTGTVFFQGRAEFGFRFPTRRLYTTEPKRMAQSNDALMSVRAPVGDMNVAYEDCCIGRGLSAIRSKDGHQSYVLYTMFDLSEQLDVFNGEGTVFGSINRDALNNLPISIPPKKVMDQFEALVSPMDAAIRNNYEEICRLESLRDSLLPRLMSGELDVSEIEI